VAEGTVEEEIRCDVLVVGTEGTGARAAIEATDRGADVLAVTKGQVARSGATVTADGEIDVDSRSIREVFGLEGSADDSPEQFARDMIIEGDYLADQRLVAIHTEEAPARVKELLDWGAPLVGLIQGPGHSHPRGLWIPGPKIARTLARQLRRRGVSVLENTMVLDLLTDEEGVLGALVLHLSTGKLLLLRSRAVVLATGGAMRAWPLTTAPEELTGDGLAMAMRRGVAVQEMEFPMFLPYTFVTPPALRGVIFPYDVSALLDVHALNRHGERYMVHWDPQRLEKSTRDINSVGAAMEIRAGRGSPAGGTYLSFKHLPRKLLDFSAEWFPGNMRDWRAAGFQLQDFMPGFQEEAWEVAPACHFWNGGIRIDEHCATNVPGLFAAGEGTAGIHGANRLTGNALTMTQVWGKRAGSSAAAFAQSAELREPSSSQIQETRAKVLQLLSPSSGPTVVEVRRQIRRIAREAVWIVRDERTLLEALSAVSGLRDQLGAQRVRGHDLRFNRELLEGLQNENMLDVLEAVARASLARQESRGAMYRTDYRFTDDDRWLCNLIVRHKDGQWDIRAEPVKEVYVPLPRGQRTYGQKGDKSGASK
jgi:succinate dehydrogenase/fumarate reductase flavoprotein subunit